MFSPVFIENVLFLGGRSSQMFIKCFERINHTFISWGIPLHNNLPAVRTPSPAFILSTASQKSLQTQHPRFPFQGKALCLQTFHCGDVISLASVEFIN